MTDFYVNRKNNAPAHEGAFGLKFKDKRGRITNYTPDSNGRITVDNPEHARTIEQAAHNDGGVIQKATGMSTNKTPSKHCTPCRFLAYRWQTTCPRCGRPLEEGER